MRRALLLSVAIVCPAFGADSFADVSKYSAQMQVVSQNPSESTITYGGRAKLTGILFVEFDMESPSRANGAVNVAKFVPDRESASVLPAVISGPYHGQIKYVSLEPAEVALQAAVGSKRANTLSRGSRSWVRIPVQLTLTNFTTGIECDSRVYFAQVVSADIKPSPKRKALAGVPPHGC